MYCSIGGGPHPLPIDSEKPAFPLTIGSREALMSCWF